MPQRSKLVSTGLAAQAIGVDPSTLWRWQQAGRVKPAWMTPGGRARWNLESLSEQLGFTLPGQ